MKRCPHTAPVLPHTSPHYFIVCLSSHLAMQTQVLAPSMDAPINALISAADAAVAATLPTGAEYHYSAISAAFTKPLALCQKQLRHSLRAVEVGFSPQVSPAMVSAMAEVGSQVGVAPIGSQA